MKLIITLASIIAIVCALPSPQPRITSKPLINSVPLDVHLPNSRSSDSSSQPVEPLKRRGLPGAVYFCDHNDFEGNCLWLPPSEDCHIMQLGPRSIGPDAGTYCYTFKTSNCEGTRMDRIVFPGKASGFTKELSFKCFGGQWIAGPM